MDERGTAKKKLYKIIGKYYFYQPKDTSFFIQFSRGFSKFDQNCAFNIQKSVPLWQQEIKFSK